MPEAQPVKTPPLGGKARPQGAIPQPGDDDGAGDGLLQEIGRVAAASKVDGMKWYRVTKGGQVGRSGGVMLLPTGETINSANYDVEKLLAAGVEIQECAAPGWWLEAQKRR